MNCDALRLSDGTQKPSRPSAFWPTGRGISILTNQNSSMIDETDMGNHTHQHHRSRGIIPIIMLHTLFTNIWCPAALAHCQDGGAVIITLMTPTKLVSKTVIKNGSVLPKLFVSRPNLHLVIFRSKQISPVSS